MTVSRYSTWDWRYPKWAFSIDPKFPPPRGRMGAHPVGDFSQRSMRSSSMALSMASLLTSSFFAAMDTVVSPFGRIIFRNTSLMYSQKSFAASLSQSWGLVFLWKRTRFSLECLPAGAPPPHRKGFVSMRRGLVCRGKCCHDGAQKKNAMGDFIYL